MSYVAFFYAIIDRRYSSKFANTSVSCLKFF